MNEEFLWVEKYRPKTIEDTILPVDLKVIFQQFVDQRIVERPALDRLVG